MSITPRGHGRLTSITSELDELRPSLLERRRLAAATFGADDGGSDLHEPTETSGARQSPRSGDCGTLDVSLRCHATWFEGSRNSLRSLRQLRRRTTDGHPRDNEGSCRSLPRDMDGSRRSLPSFGSGPSSTVISIRPPSSPPEGAAAAATAQSTRAAAAATAEPTPRPLNQRRDRSNHITPSRFPSSSSAL